MKRISLLLSVILTSLTLSAQEADKALALDSLSTVIRNADMTIAQLSSEVSGLKQENAALVTANENFKKRLRNVEVTLSELQGESKVIQDRVENAERGVETNKASITETQTGLSQQITTTDDKLNHQVEVVKSKTIWGLIIAIVVLLISAVLTLVLNKKGNVKIAVLQSKADKLNEEIVNKLTSEASELQKIASNIGSLSTVVSDDSAEQELIKALADKITFMEMTLYKMDKSVRGHKHLTKSIAQMKDNLLANGYEIVDMLGKPYHSGMKVTANFIDDDTLEEGAQIITGIVKPQINYKDKVIQTAQISVSQNI
jgi:FtsZ-binding cell division protein ZapB